MATEKSTETAAQAAPKKRERKSLVDRSAGAVEKCADALALVKKRVDSWRDAARDEDTRATYTLIGETLGDARTLLASNEIAKLIRDNAPKSARATDYSVGDFVHIRAKYLASFADSVENAKDLDDLCVFSVKPAMIGVRTGSGDRLFVLRSQIHPADTTEAGADADDGEETDTEETAAQ